MFKIFYNFVFLNFALGCTMRGTYFYGSQGPLLILNLKHVPTKSGVAYNFNFANFFLGRRGEAQEHLGPWGLTLDPDPPKP